jgi:membrane fusion protein (multidrug efflux system)
MEAGRGTAASLLKIRARRLEAEIGMAEAKAEKPGGKRQKIIVDSPQVKNVTITHQYVCQIHARRYIKVRALQKGYIETIPVKEGQAVKQGDLLFKIVPGLYRAKLDAQLAEVKIAEIELQNAERLSKQNVVSQNEVTLVRSKLEKARAKAQVARIELAFTEVRAPFDGLIDRLHEQQGSMITEADTLTTLSDNSVMWVYFSVPQARYLEYVAGGGPENDGEVELVLANGNEFKYHGKIGAVQAQFNRDTGTIPFRADFPNPDRLLRHGMTGEVLIRRTLNNAVVIPQRAAFEVLGKHYVHVVDRENVVHRREIAVRNEVDDLFVIAGGVGADDRIIVQGTQQVRDGETLK